MWPIDVLGDPAWRSLTWALLHFVWQGAIIAFVWMILLRLVPTRRTQIRYLLGLAGLLAMVTCPVATYFTLQSDAIGHESRLSAAFLPITPGMPVADSTAEIGASPSPCSPDLSWDVTRWRLWLAEWIDGSQAYLLGGWLVGLFLLSGRLLLGVVGMHRLARGRRVVPEDTAHRVARIAGRMGLTRVPGVFASEATYEAVVVGLLRPIVLLPAAWLAEMTPEVLDAVIAHELAHIRRLDVWANLFQRLVETLLFYHPAVWWLSRRVRLAREMCCDELAIRATGDRVVYANALELAALKQLTPSKSFLEVALGVTQMTLLNRVRNVLGLVVRHEQGRWWPAAVLALLAPLAIWLASAGAVTPTEDRAALEQNASSVGSPKRVKPDGKYTASVLLRVAMQERPIMGAAGTTETDRDRFDIYKNTQRQLLMSRFVLSAALRKKEVAGLPSVKKEQASGDAAAWLAAHLFVDFPGNAEVMEVAVNENDPKEAAILVNAVVDAYLTEVVNTERDMKRQRLSELDRAFVEKETEVRAKRSDLKQLAEQLGTSDSDAISMKQKLALEELTSSRQEVTKMQSELRQYQREIAGLEASLKDANEQEQAPLVKSRNRMQAEVAVVKEQLHEMQDDVQRMQKEVKNFGLSTVDIEMLRSDIKSVESVLTGLAAEREKLKVEIRATPRVTLLLRAEIPAQ